MKSSVFLSAAGSSSGVPDVAVGRFYADMEDTVQQIRSAVQSMCGEEVSPGGVFDSAHRCAHNAPMLSFWKTPELHRIEPVSLSPLEPPLNTCDTSTLFQVCHEIIQVEGHTGKKLCEVARDKSANLLVVGSPRRRSGASRRRPLSPSSVSDFVLRHAHCPVCVW